MSDKARPLATIALREGDPGDHVSFRLAIDGAVSDQLALRILAAFLHQFAPKYPDASTLSSVLQAEGTWYAVIARRRDSIVEAFVAACPTRDDAQAARSASVARMGIEDVEPDIVLDDGTIVRGPAGRA